MSRRALTERVILGQPSSTALLLQLRKILLPILAGTPFVGSVAHLFGATQLDAADLAGDRFREVGEFEAADALVGGEALAEEAVEEEGGVARRLDAGLEHDAGLGHREAELVRARDDRSEERRV